MPAHAVLKQRHKSRIHEIVIIRNIEANDSCTAKVTTKALLHLRAMRPFHNNDDIRPAH